MKEFATAKALHAERQKLQKQLGLPVSERMLTHMSDAHTAVRELRAFASVVEQAERGEAVKTNTAIAPAPAKAKARPALTREQCSAIMTAVFHESPRTFAELTDANLLEDVTARITDARLVCPGVRPVDDGPPLRSFGLINRGIRQDNLNKVLKITENQQEIKSHGYDTRDTKSFI